MAEAVGPIVIASPAPAASSPSTPVREWGPTTLGVQSFALPFPIAGFTISMLWHPRMDGDLAHRGSERFCVA